MCHTFDEQQPASVLIAAHLTVPTNDLEKIARISGQWLAGDHV